MVRADIALKIRIPKYETHKIQSDFILLFYL